MKSSEMTLGAPSAKKGSKRWRNLFVILGMLVLLGWLGFLWLASYLEKQLQAKVTEAGMTLTYEDIHWHLIPAGVSFDKVHLQASENDSIFSVSLDHAGVKLGLLDILAGRYQQISQIKLHDGNIAIFQMDSLKALIARSKRPATENEEKPAHPTWEIKDIDLSKIGLSISGEKGFDLQLQSFEGSLQAQYVDSGYQFGILKKPVDMVVTDCNVKTLFQYHGFHADTLGYRMKAEELRMAGLHIFPKVSRDYLHVNEPYIALHADLAAVNMVASGLVWTHTDQLHFKARKVVLKEPVFTAYQDKEKPLKPGERPMPPKWIENLPFKFVVDSLHIQNGALTYTFTRATADILGRLSLDRWNLLWLKYGNDGTYTDHFTAQCNMRWMNTTEMKAAVTFPYGDPKSSFEIKGSFSEADFAAFNPVMEAAEGFHFVTGHCNSLRFAFTGDESHIKGKMWIDYDDVKIGINKVDKADKADKTGQVDKTGKADKAGKGSKEPKVVAEVEVKENLIGKNKPETKRELKQQAKEAKIGKEAKEAKVGKDPKAGKEAKVPKVAKEGHDEKGKSQVMLSIVANIMMIRPSTKGEIVEIMVYADRNLQQSVISLWLKGLMTGLKSALMRAS